MAATHRIAHLQRALQAAGLDLFVGVADAYHSFLDCDPLVALGGFRAMGPSAVVLRADGEGWLLVAPRWDTPRARAQAPHLHVLEAPDLPVALGQLLRQLGPKSVGTAYPESMPAGLADRLADCLGTLPQPPRTVEASALVRRAGAVKTADELADAREATRIAEAGYLHLLEVMRPGMREFELASDILHFMKVLGSPDNFLLMSASQHNQAVRPPGRRVLERGDVLLAEITPVYNNQFSQICRTVTLGAASERRKERFSLLQSAYAAGMAAARPGATVADAARAMNRVLTEGGLGAYCRPPYMRVRGHGLGTISQLPGDVAEDNPTVLEEGMVFVMHPNQYCPDVGYMLCGEPVLIGPEGAVALSASAAQLDSIPA